MKILTHTANLNKSDLSGVSRPGLPQQGNPGSYSQKYLTNPLLPRPNQIYNIIIILDLSVSKRNASKTSEQSLTTCMLFFSSLNEMLFQKLPPIFLINGIADISITVASFLFA